MGSGKHKSRLVYRLPYQRFSDHLIARHLLEIYLKTSTPDAIRASLLASSPLGKMFQLPNQNYRHYAEPGWAEALITEFPERVKKVKDLPPKECELFFSLPQALQDRNAYFQPFIDGLFWRNRDAFTKGTLRMVQQYLSADSVSWERTMDALVAIATKPEHPCCATRLYRYLSNCSMADRDLSWSEYLRRGYVSPSIRRLLTWAEKLETVTLSSDDSLTSLTELVVLFSLVLTTVVRSDRDLATKALVLIGEQYPKVLFSHATTSLDFNDPYLPERMLAATYGVVLSLVDSKDARSSVDSKDARSSVDSKDASSLVDSKDGSSLVDSKDASSSVDSKDASSLVDSKDASSSVDSKDASSSVNFPRLLKDLARQLYQQMFAPEAKHATHHTLMRDYALGIIEVAQRAKCAQFTKMEIPHFSRPFPNTPSSFTSKGKPDDRVKSAIGWAIQKDFGNYTIGRLIPNRRNYDDTNLDYKKTRAKIERRIFDLGYREERFKNVESEIGRYSSVGHYEADKVDRYGKKYSWIAYFEMWGERDAKQKLPSDRNQESRTPDCGIDPTFPKVPPDWLPPLPNLFGSPTAITEEWVSGGYTPNWRTLLVVSKINEHQHKKTVAQPR